MADAGDLKSSGDFTPCGFDSHPGHPFATVPLQRNVSEIILTVSIQRDMMEPQIYKRRWSDFYIVFSLQQWAIG